MNTQKVILSTGILTGFVAYSVLQTPGLAQAIAHRIQYGEEHDVTAPGLTAASPTPIASVPSNSHPSPVAPRASSSVTPSPTPKASPISTGLYRDGEYLSPVEDAFYGNLQIKVTISGGKIADVGLPFVQYPNDRRTSVEINSQAMPYLRQEAISAQNAKVAIVSGATATSEAFSQALSAVLTQAKR
jgi:uncharacterized protein with FMN-binding domain